MKGEGRVQDRGFGAAKHEGLEVADEREKIGEADQTLYGSLQSKENCLE